MKKITNYKLHVTRIAFCLLLSAFCLIANAQVDENKTSDTDFVQKIELKMPSEITEIVLTPIKEYPHVYLSEYDKKYWSQVEKLQLGKPFPEYSIDNDTLKLSGWLLPFLFHGDPLFLARGTRTNRGDYTFLSLVERDKAERILNYEYKDSIVGILEQIVFPQMTYLIIRKENREIFVQDYDKTTHEYFKNENSFSEVINLRKDIIQKDELKRAQRPRFSLDSLPKNELKITPEITKIAVNEASSLRNSSDMEVFNWGIKDRAQLENVYPEKPIPEYMIDYNNEKLIFTDRWHMLVMSNGEPLFMTIVKLEENGQYRWVGSGSGGGTLHNYEHKDLIIGCIRVISAGFRYLIIRKDNKNIIVGMPTTTRKYFKEYSLQEVIKEIKD